MDAAPLPGFVRPRVQLKDVPGSLPLLDEVLTLDLSKPGLIALIGPAGTGKSTALKFLRASLPADQFAFVDESLQNNEMADTSKTRIYAARQPLKTNHLAIYRLAPWTQDDLIEFLLPHGKEQCASVLARIQKLDTSELEGRPELWRVILDEMLADESVVDLETCFRRRVQPLFINPQVTKAIHKCCFAEQLRKDSRDNLMGAYSIAMLSTGWDSIAKEIGGRPNARLLAYPIVQRRLATDLVMNRIHEQNWTCFEVQWPRPLIQDVASALSLDTRAQEILRDLLSQSMRHAQPVAASLMHRANAAWQPNVISGCWMEKAVLDCIEWPLMHLAHSNFNKADLTNANLSDANLNHCVFTSTDLSQANLTGATLEQADCTRASFTDAILNKASAKTARFNLACLRRVQARGTDFSHANLRNAEIEGADFTDAHFFKADLTGLPLHQAQLAGANFDRAILCECDLELVQLRRASFMNAHLEKALLTGSVLVKANFEGAYLCNAGLAEIDWEFANLRGADLRGATFHMGSTRTGHVNSTVACEGSKTGFYTDEYYEQSYLAPERIRKANLRGADLRGANIENVDFYLVDLRDALLDPDQLPQLKKCGAILEHRVKT